MIRVGGARWILRSFGVVAASAVLFAMWTVPVGPWWASLVATLFGAGLGGVHRFLRPEAAAENRIRRQILDILLKVPGIRVCDLASMIGVRRQTIRFHLNVLTEFGSVQLLRDGRTVRVYPAEWLLEGDFTVSHLLFRPWAQRVLEEITLRPEISVRGLARRMGVSHSTVRWYLQRLRGEGALAHDEAPSIPIRPAAGLGLPLLLRAVG